MEILTCEKCGHFFVFSGVRKAPTVFIYCEKCEYCIEATSDYGFGPTIPAQIFKGSRLLAVVKGARTFYDADNNKLDIKLPPQSRKESLYTRIFSICSDVADYLMEKEKTEKNEKRRTWKRRAFWCFLWLWILRGWKNKIHSKL